MVDLSSSKTTDESYFFISTTLESGSDLSMAPGYIEQADIYLSSQKVTSRKKYIQPPINSTDAFFDVDQEGPISIILYHGILPEIKLMPEKPYIDFDPNCRILRQIKATMMVSVW